MMIGRRPKSFPALLSRHRISLLCLLATVPWLAQGATIRIPDDYATTQKGMDAALVGDTVLVAPGTYTGDGNRPLFFNDKDIVLLGEAGADATIIDCELVDRAVVFEGNESRDAVLEGLTLLRGNGYGKAGVAVFGGSPRYEGCQISHNFAWGRAGGVWVEGGQVSFIVCKIEANTARHSSGGGIILANGNHELIRCEILDNVSISVEDEP